MEQEQKLIPVMCYLKPGEDDHLINWLTKQKGKSKSKIMRRALEDYWQRKASNGNGSQVAQATINPEAIYEAVDQALANRLDLVSIRQVVEAGVSNALANLPLTAVATQNGDQAENEENWLEDFDDFIID